MKITRGSPAILMNSCIGGIMCVIGGWGVCEVWALISQKGEKVWNGLWWKCGESHEMDFST